MYCIFKVETIDGVSKKTPVSSSNWDRPAQIEGRYPSLYAAWLDCPKPKEGVKWMPAYVLPPEGADGLVCVDFDGEGSDQRAQEFYESLPAGAYLESSQSGVGRHVWLNATLDPSHQVKKSGSPVEVYSHSRGVICGEPIRGVFPPMGDHTRALEKAMEEWGLDLKRAKVETPAVTHKNVDDDKVWDAAFIIDRDLLGGNMLRLAMLAPDATGNRAYDASTADFILASTLWQAGAVDEAQVERLMRRSGLLREKWDTHKSYLTRTIDAARPVAQEETDGEYTRGGRIKKAEEFFSNCVYLAGRGRILTPEGHDLSPADFDVVFGGSVWALDDRKTTRKASEAFLQSSDFRPRIAMRETFRPDRNWLDLTVRAGVTCVNTYRKHKPDLIEGDISMFLKILEANFPNVSDREHLVSWCAAAIQEPATRFLWAPVVIGIQGSGKNVITHALRLAIGEEYTHAPKPDPKGLSKFNGYVAKKILVLPEEAQYTKDSLEVLKPLITNPWVEVEAKGRDQCMIENYARFFLTGNNLGAIPHDPNERRFAFFVTPFDTAEDIRSSGLDAVFWEDFWTWVRNEQGWAKVAYWLSKYEIKKGFHPVRDWPQAPITSTAIKARDGGLSEAALELREALENGSKGFNGGFIYSPSARELLHGSKRISYSLKQLGYHEIPQFKGNAVNRTPNGFTQRGRLYTNNPASLVGLTPEQVIVKFEECNK